MNSLLKLLFIGQLLAIYYNIRENYRKYIRILDLLKTTFNNCILYSLCTKKKVIKADILFVHSSRYNTHI